MAIAETLSVLTNPWMSSSRLSWTNAQRSKRREHQRRSGGGRAAAPPGVRSRAHGVHARRRRRRVRERVVRPQDVLSRTRSGSAAGRSPSGSGGTGPSSSSAPGAESTQAFSAVLPCLMPMPNGASRNVSLGQLRAAVGGRHGQQDGVVVHHRVGATLLEREHRVRERVGDDDLGVLEAVLHPAVVDRAARRRDALAGEVRELLHRTVVLDEQPAGRLVVGAARSRCACRGRRCR